MSKQCPVTRGEVDLDWYAEQDKELRDLGLAAPARRALVNAGLTTVAKLKKKSAADLKDLHGIGPSALKILKPILKASR